MNRIVKTIITVVGTIIFCAIIALFVPVLREPFLLLLTMAWQIIKAFFLEDIVKAIALYLVIAGIIAALGFTISAKTENKIWGIVSVLLDIITLIAFIARYN